jgi:hypothetical protein
MYRPLECSYNFAIQIYIFYLLAIEHIKYEPHNSSSNSISNNSGIRCNSFSTASILKVLMITAAMTSSIKGQQL